MLPGHGSVFQQLPRRRRAHLSLPYAATQPDSRQRHIKYENTRVVKNHPRISCSLKPPNDNTAGGTNKEDPLGPLAMEIQSTNAKTPPPPPECASALAGDISDGSGAIMRPISTAPTPRESNGTPWGVSRHWGHRKCQNTRVVKNHLRISHPSRPPVNTAPPGTHQDHPQPPHAAEKRPKNTQTPPASPKSASALSGDVGDNRAQFCARFRRRPPPGSP